MDIAQLSDRAMQIRSKYAELEKKRLGREWTTAEIMQGMVVDMGELMELVMAKEGIRDDKRGDLDLLLKREISDCLWCLLVLAKKYNFDMEKEFLASMDKLEERIQELSK